jgi:hypothetical protein
MEESTKIECAQQFDRQTKEGIRFDIELLELVQTGSGSLLGELRRCLGHNCESMNGTALKLLLE